MPQYDIAAYIWPAYTGSELRTRMFWPQGNGEWQTVQAAHAKFPGHTWPRRPLWGYVDEADPAVMEMEIREAVSHGVNVFIYDWYWYDRRPFLENCLNDGFLGAQNNGEMQFYLMWANHDATHLWNRELADTAAGNTVIWDGKVDRATFETIATRIITRYFSRDNYYRIDGCPVFMIYELYNLIEGLGGMAKTADALAWFRDRTRAAGFPGLHLQATGRGESTLNLSGVDGRPVSGEPEVMRQLGIDSFTHYQFCHFTDIDRDYGAIMRDVRAEWARIDTAYETPYFPHISCGWDNNPRYKTFRPGIMKDNTPENFEAALRDARAYADAHGRRLVTINSWNEWTETSYLEPDDLYGYGYLDAVRRVFLEGK